MRTSTIIGLAAGLAVQVFAACNAALKIDDFSKWSSNTNSLGEWTSDDNTMSSISARNGVLSFTPKNNAYFYETFQCQTASNNGLDTIQFTIKGPSRGYVTLELQSKSSCSSGDYKSAYTQITGLTGNTQTVTVPLSRFSGANANAVTGLAWSGFSSNAFTWQLSNIEFGCSTGSAPSSVVPSASSVRPSSGVPSSSVVPSASRSVSASSSRAQSSSAAQSSSVASLSSRATSSSAVSSSASSLSSGASSSVGSSTRGSSSSVVSSTRGSSSSVASSTRGSSSSVSSSSGTSSSVGSSTRVSSSTVTSSSIRTSSSSVSSSRTTLVTASSATPSGTCPPLLIEDWISQSRLTFLFYNSMNYPTSTEESLESITVGRPSTNRVEIVPKAGGGGYFYSQFPCVNAKNKYGGISLRIKAPRGTTFTVQLDSSSTCDPTTADPNYQTTADLGWTFDGTEKLYLIPFSKYPNLNTEKLTTILFSGFSGTVNFGPMAFYCGATGEYIPPTTTPGSGSSSTIAAPSNTAAASLVVDKFADPARNNLGFYHGGDDGMTLAYNNGQLTITAPDADYSFYTQVSASCENFEKYKGSYLHIAYSGTTDFTVALQQHNSGCNANVAPFPETWDSAEAGRYAKNGHIYIPMNHFKIELSRVIGFSIKGFHTKESVTLSVIEIVSSVPAGTAIPPKDETGTLVFACKRPNSFAFAIDDGSPEYAQDVLKIIREENIKVTFFTVGAPLLDERTNLTNVYKEMLAAGHQLALHSFTHPKMESLPDYAGIDWEYNEDIKVMKSQFNGLETPYFRPPFGNEGARMRSRLAKAVGNKATITNWSVDVEDWLWAQSDRPQEQLTAFKRDIAKGGNLVVLHYLYPSTVGYLREFIQLAKATGKQLMRVDQCMMDPSAPPL